MSEMFTTVAHYTDPIEAHVARGLLAAEGVDAHLGDEHLAFANWEWRLATGGVKLRVANHDVARAERVLRAMEAGDYAIDEDGDPDLHGAMQTPDRETRSSRLAWLALMLFSVPLPWRRRGSPDDRRVRCV